MSFQQGISGLNATARNLEVIGNNIANASTVGSKSSRAEFADVYATALGGGGGKISGIGVSVASVAQNFSQGSVRSTNSPLDLAIGGNGFFQVKNGDNAVQYTRNGQFRLDREGRIANSQGDVLMGYAADAGGVVQPGQARALVLSSGAIAPQSTTRVDIGANLDSRASITRPAVAPFMDIGNASTYNSATSVTANDSNGKDVAVTYYFQKTAAENWDVYATANGEMMNGTNALPLPIQSIVFPATGTAPTSPAGPFLQNIPASALVNGVGTMLIPNVAMDFSQFTQFASGFGVTRLSQDGFTAGALTGVSVESNGLIRANYSNGQAKAIGQLELATFVNMNGLQPLGGNKWARTADSGDPVLGVPGSGNLGALQTSALEDSNVDLTGELVSMMVAQRIYQANAQTIKTQDQVLQTLVNLR